MGSFNDQPTNQPVNLTPSGDSELMKYSLPPEALYLFWERPGRKKWSKKLRDEERGRGTDRKRGREGEAGK